MLALTGVSVLAADAPALEKRWPIEGYWLPEAASTYAEEVDWLFNFILYLTTAVFIVTEALLLIFLVKYRRREGARGVYTHGNHTLEMVWTLTPAAILALIAFIQKPAWDKIKKPEKFPSGADTVYVQNFAQQFTWNFRYPGNDGKWGTKDDILLDKQLYVPVNKNIIIEQTSYDVIHAFFLPYHRLKQDVVPGMQIKLWFNSTKSTKQMQEKRSPEWNFEIVCAELCGIQHAQMRGVMYVLEQAEYDKWHQETSAEFGKGDREANTPIWKKWKVNEKGERVFDRKVVTGEKAAH